VLPNTVVRIPLDQDGWNGLPRSRQALMQLDPGDPGVCTSAIRQKSCEDSASPRSCSRVHLSRLQPDRGLAPSPRQNLPQAAECGRPNPRPGESDTGKFFREDTTFKGRSCAASARTRRLPKAICSRTRQCGAPEICAGRPQRLAQRRDGSANPVQAPARSGGGLHFRQPGANRRKRVLLGRGTPKGSVDCVHQFRHPLLSSRERQSLQAPLRSRHPTLRHRRLTKTPPRPTPIPRPDERDEAAKAGRTITRIALASKPAATASGWRAGLLGQKISPKGM
jgi:hypothetical protein